MVYFFALNLQPCQKAVRKKQIYNGSMAEWLGSALQKHLLRFESGWNLKKNFTLVSEVFFML